MAAIAQVNIVARVATPAKESSFAGAKVVAARPVAVRAARFQVLAADAPAAEAPKVFVPPKLDPNTPSPIFGGSTGGLLRKAQVEEFYVLTWEAKKECIFEMPVSARRDLAGLGCPSPLVPDANGKRVYPKNPNAYSSPYL